MRLKTVGAGLLGAVVLFGGGLAAFEKIAEARIGPAPGQMVDIGGYRLHLDCRGQGSPTVVLESGLGDPAISWSEVQPALARDARVCSYDRAGLGWSDAGPQPRDPNRETDELHALVSRAHLDTPFVLVGHSYGGDLSRLYAARFPGEVAGLVLVEATNEDQWWKIPEARDSWGDFLRDCRTNPWRARFGLLRLRHDSLPAYAPSVLPIAESFSYTPKETIASCSEGVALMGPGPSELRPVRSLGALPLIVVSAGKNFWQLAGSERVWHEWQGMQMSDTALSSRFVSRVIAVKAGHEVQYDEPAVVIAQVQRMLSVIRGFHSAPKQLTFLRLEQN